MRLRTIGQKLKPSTRTKVHVPQKTANPFYASPEWRALTEAIIKQRDRECEDPAHDVLQPRSGRRIYGDHIRELKDGGAPLDARNIMLRCGSCHTRKTAAVRAGRFHRGGGQLFEPTPGGYPHASHARETLVGGEA